MLKFSEIFELSKENSYFERIRMVRMVRMVRSLADRTFQLWPMPVAAAGRGGHLLLVCVDLLRLHGVLSGENNRLWKEQPGHTWETLE